MIKTIVLLVALLSDDPMVFSVVGHGDSKVACEQAKERLQPKTDKKLECLVVVVPETI
jgi:hypothetical protein